MDDRVGEFDDVGTKRVLRLLIKRSATNSCTASNDEFRRIIAAAVKAEALGSFTHQGADVRGFVVGTITADTVRSPSRLIDWAKASKSLKTQERVKGIESSASAWRAVVAPTPDTTSDAPSTRACLKSI